MKMATQHLGYPMANGILGDCHCKPIGTWRSVSAWRVNSWIGSHMHQIEAVIDGVTYTGRGFGEGMALTGRPKRTNR
jgi:hypothetical protein